MTDRDHTPSPTHCISCGTEVPDHAKFCHACGSAVYRPEDTSQPPKPAPVESPVLKTSSELAASRLRQRVTASGPTGEVEPPPPIDSESVPRRRVLRLAGGRQLIVALALVGISLIIGLATIGSATDKSAHGALVAAFSLCFTGLVILSKGRMSLRVPVALFLAVTVFGYFGLRVDQQLSRQRLLASQAMRHQRVQEVAVDYGENRESNLADMNSIEAFVGREEWEEARDAASELRARTEPLLEISLGMFADDFPEIADFQKRFENAYGRIRDSERAVLDDATLREYDATLREAAVDEARRRSERAQEAQQRTYFGPWRDTLFSGSYATMRITDHGGGKATLRSVYTDGSELVQELREVKPRATERRRWEEITGEHVYAIRKSNGSLGLFDRQGHIRTARQQ